ncbi:MAG: DsbC family protein, partial [Deltaproteobacteria bacterium]|nr:DsbC family protein [Deltaproteobacteria bacterium]
MNLKTASLCISVLVILASTTMAFAVTPGESLKKNFPNIPPIDSITPSNVSGLYEVITGQQIFYYAPDAECIVGGPIVTKEGKNLTREKQRELEQKRIAQKAK